MLQATRSRNDASPRIFACTYVTCCPHLLFIPPLLPSLFFNHRNFQGDRFHHLHSRSIEDAALTTISDLLNRTTGAADLPQSAFAAAGVEVCGADCTAVGEEEADLSDSYKMAWEVHACIVAVLLCALHNSCSVVFIKTGVETMCLDACASTVSPVCLVPPNAWAYIDVRCNCGKDPACPRKVFKSC